MAELNQLVIESESRNEQILSDTIACVQNGRTPLVMTKYKEHAKLLYQRLQGRADHVFLLQGGKSSKERTQIREALLAVPETDTMIVVAIGKYIGEGFNLPRLDTLLLAMPISWQGNVEQYAGRLNRDYDGKQDVIIFDYIDAHVPTLERMYHKRLRAYRQIGFEICTNLKAAQEEPAGTIFDAQTDANIRYHATRTHHWSDSKNDYTETQHYMLLRQGSVAFEHVPMDGSTKMPDDLMESIAPFDFSDAVDFPTAYLSGFVL